MPPSDTAVHVAIRPTGEQDVVRVMRPVKRRVSVREIWDSRDVAWVVAVRDMKIKYTHSFLGPAWLVLHPLGVLVGLIFVFNGVSSVDTGDVPYGLFALGGLSAWTFVQMSIMSGTNVFIMNSGLVRRVAFPRSALFTASLLANLLPAGVILAAALGWTLFAQGFEAQILLLPVLALWLSVLVAGAIFVLGSLCVRYRDIFALVPFWMQIGLFVTPVGYPLDGAPETLRTLLALNPLTGVLEAWRWCLFGFPPDQLSLITAGIGTAVVASLGWWVYARLEISFADYI